MRIRAKSINLKIFNFLAVTQLKQDGSKMGCISCCLKLNSFIAVLICYLKFEQDTWKSSLKYNFQFVTQKKKT